MSILSNFSSAAFTNASGLEVAAAATIEVRREVDNSLASLFADEAGVTPLGNPFAADADGRFEFYVVGIDEGYKISVTKDGDTHVLRHQALGNARFHDVTDYFSLIFASEDDQDARGLLFAKPDKIAASISAASTLVLDVDGDYIVVSGNTGVNTVTLAEGREVQVRFTGTPIITEGASLITGVGNIQVVAGALMTFRGEASSVVRLTAFKAADGAPLAVPNPALVGSAYKNLVVSCASDALLTMTADELVLKNSSGASVLVSSLSAAAEIALGVAPSGLDSGAEGANSWYYVWCIRKTSPLTDVSVTGDSSTDRITYAAHGLAAGTPVKFGGTPPTGLTAGTTYYVRDVTTNDFKLAATPNGSAIDLTTNGTGVTMTELPALLLSTSTSTPTLPSGYTYKGLYSVVRNDGSSNFIQYAQTGDEVEYAELFTIFDGSATTLAWTSFTASSFFPAIAKKVRVSLGNGGNTAGISPRSDGFGASVGRHGAGSGSDDYDSMFPTARANWYDLSARYAATMYYQTQVAATSLIAAGYTLNI